MKSFNMFAILMLFFIIAFSQAFAQRDVSWGDNGTGYKYVTHYDTVLTVAGNKSSTAFTLSEYLKSNWVTYPWNIEITATVPSTGTPKGIVYIEKGYTATGTFTDADTLKSSDSTYTNWCTQVDLNSWKYPYYKIKYTTTSVSADSVIFHFSMGNPKKD